MQFLITAIFAVISLLGMASPCPSDCKCTVTQQGFTVDCSNRGLSSIPTDIPINTDVLNLERNEISEIKRGAFNNLPNLWWLILENNKISVIEDHAFNNVPSLTGIDLVGNKITNVEAWFFSGIPKIARIDMCDNIISFVSEKTFQNLSKNAILKFKMICGCKVNIPFWKWVTHGVTFQSSIECYDYPGLHLRNLKKEDFFYCNGTSSTPSTTKSRTRITRKKLEAPPFTFRAVIGISIGAGSLAGGILLFCVIWRLWRPSKDKEEKFEQQPNNINSKKNTTEFIPPKTNRKVTANYIE